MVEDNIRRLKLHECININDDGSYSPTFLGYLASFYYVKHETVLHFWKS